ncbi:vacuolar iron transporter homolog 2.1-like [Neltuma alba]|uniref:vacuolar iron transporter homolog 2.1-like n=1 Tax=Neltuma alba TaxID=207710 RepID=UPI0010A3B873|nr:vacuolar iron transporter homolog 2.1-like [Prosopis alba]
MSEDEEEEEETVKSISSSICINIPLLATAFTTGHKIKLTAVAIVASLALTVYGYVGALLGKTPILRSCVRVVSGGLVAMAYGYHFLTKLLGSCGLQIYE